jgi:hypothetical protein
MPEYSAYTQIGHADRSDQPIAIRIHHTSDTQGTLIHIHLGGTYICLDPETARCLATRLQNVLKSSEVISGRTLALKHGLSFGELLAELLRDELDRESGSHSVKA